jgi:hypothetical protein
MGGLRSFLATTVLTSVTGFLFPRDHLLPPHIVGITSLVVLAVAILALYVYRLARSWRWIYVTGAVVALYLNVFVEVVQAFQKLPLLQPLAPTQSDDHARALQEPTTDSNHDGPIFPNLAKSMVTTNLNQLWSPTSPTSRSRPASIISLRSWMPGHDELSAMRSARGSMHV